MSRWKDAIENHPLNETIKNLIQFVSKEHENTSSSAAVEKRRFLKIMDIFQDVLKNVDPELAAIPQLDSWNSIFSGEITGHAASYNGTGDEGYLVAANNALTNVLPYLADFVAISKKLAAEKPLRGLDTFIDSEIGRLTTAIQALNEKNNGNATYLTQLQERSEQLAVDIDSKKKETNELIANWQSQFSESQERRQVSFNEAMGALAKQIADWRETNQVAIVQNLDKFIADARATFETKQDAFSKEIDEYLTEAIAKHAAILELYELTAGDSVAASYTKSANDEKKDANFWRWATIGFVVATVVWAAFCYITGGDITHFINLFKDATPDDVSAKVVAQSGQSEPSNAILWLQILKSLSVTGVLLFGAGYSAKQSNYHRDNERQTRRFALELKAIDPFIASLDKADQTAMKLKLTEKLFGKDQSEQLVAPQTDSNLLETIFKGIVDVIKAK